MIDTALKGFLEKELEALELDFLMRVKRMNLNQGQIINLIAEMDFFKELQGLGLTKIVDKLEKEYSGIVNQNQETGGVKISALSLRELNIIKDLDVRSLLGQAENYATQFKSKLLKGLLSGEGNRTIANELEGMSLTSPQIVTAITTSRDEFNSIVLAKEYEEYPNQLFRLAGILDNRTRCACKAVLAFQPPEGFTKQEVDEGLLTKIAKEHCPKFKGQYTWTFRGGFNCRHYYEPIIEGT
jgi:hypothetical protein